MVPSVYFVPLRFMPDDLEAEPRLVVAIIRALVADGVRVLAGLEKHAHDRAVINAAIIANEKPAVRLFGVVVDRLPKPRSRRLCAKRMAGCDKRQKSGSNRRVSCSHLAFLRI